MREERRRGRSVESDGEREWLGKRREKWKAKRVRRRSWWTERNSDRATARKRKAGEWPRWGARETVTAPTSTEEKRRVAGSDSVSDRTWQGVTERGGAQWAYEIWRPICLLRSWYNIVVVTSHDESEASDIRLVRSHDEWGVKQWTDSCTVISYQDLRPSPIFGANTDRPKSSVGIYTHRLWGVVRIGMQGVYLVD